MMLNVVSLEQAFRITQTEFSAYETVSEKINISDCLGRVLSEDIVSTENIPPFNRSTVDGYAVIASDTFGASEGTPSMLTVPFRGSSTRAKVRSSPSPSEATNWAE